MKMTESNRLLREGRKEELWTKHCGYVNLSMDDFMGIQKRLLKEQLHHVGNSPVGKAIMGDKIPETIEEFKHTVPFTTYNDYAPMLEGRNEDMLPEKPYVWARTSGRSSDKGPKWLPLTRKFYEYLGDAVIGSMLMSSCSFPGDVRIERNDKFLLATAPRPYLSGYISYSGQELLDVQFLPSLDEGENMDYGSRVALGFKLAMHEGLDYFMGLASVLARIGEQFAEESGNTTKPSKDLLNPFVLWRLLRALFISKTNNRPLLPKDIWRLKGIMTGGTDTDVYKDKIEYYWGIKPLEGYACTEAGNLAMQSWNFKGMTFFPDSAFLEFIPLEEHLKNQEDPDYVPKTYTYDQLDVGIYELVFTNFHGGILLRYRVGDFFEVTSIGDDEINSVLPQVRFYSRVIDVIDIGTLARFTERNVWKAIDTAGLPYQDWLARKEVLDTHPQLHLYIEPKNGENILIEDAKEKIDRELTRIVPEYEDLKSILNYDPLKVSLLPEGAFMGYMNAQQEAGADLAHIKPPHMQPSEKIMERLLNTKE